MSKEERPGAAATELARKWQELAERRRSHLLEMHRSGRWRRYYTEEQLTAQMRDAVRGIAQWSAAGGKAPVAEDKARPLGEAAE
jgi:uncharacterized repeat protein (TIGR03809 family)